jgi:tyrosyl-tRNA synthetase
MHGNHGLAEAQRATEALFGDLPFADLDERTLSDAFTTAPSTEMAAGGLRKGVGILEILVSAGAATSNGEARRLVTQGGVRINNAVVDDPAHTIDTKDLVGDGAVVIRVGKKRYFLVRFR